MSTIDDPVKLPSTSYIFFIRIIKEEHLYDIASTYAFFDIYIFFISILSVCQQEYFFTKKKS